MPKGGAIIEESKRGAFVGEIGIGRMARLNCVSEKALRIYHQKQLLEPKRIDEETGYRFYSYDQCATIDLIQQMRDIGMSLGEVKELLDQGDAGAFESKVREQVHKIDEELRALELARSNAMEMLDEYKTVREKSLVGKIVLERLPERRMLRFPLLNPEAEYLGKYAQKYLEEWEFNLRLTKGYMQDHGIPLSFFRRVGCITSRADLVRREYRFSGTFVFVHEWPSAGEELRALAPGGLYLTLLQDGYAGPKGGNMGLHCLEKVLNFADEHKFAIAGDYLGEIIAETPAFSYEGRDMLFKIQVPISLDD